MFRGIEMILKGRDPRDAWAFAQRICGVCTTVHAIASIRAVENAIGAVPPPNARLLRNLIIASQCVQDHVVHFYHLHALDWVDIVSALSADPAKTSALAQSISDWGSLEHDVLRRHPGARQGLRRARAARALRQRLLGPPGLPAAARGEPHGRRALPGGPRLAARVHQDPRDPGREEPAPAELPGRRHGHADRPGPAGLPQRRVDRADAGARQEGRATSSRRSTSRTSSPSPPSTRTGPPTAPASATTWSTASIPRRTAPKPAAFLPSGVIRKRDLAKVEKFDPSKITEHVKHSWYEYARRRRPGAASLPGRDEAQVHGSEASLRAPRDGGKYSWLKSPRYDGEPMEVGPLARMLVAYASGHPRVKELVGARSRQAQRGARGALLDSRPGRRPGASRPSSSPRRWTTG